MTYVTLVLVAFVGVAVVTPLVRVVATRIGAVAHPSDDRWHRRPMPLLGGVAIYSGTMIALALGGGRDRETFLIAGIGTATFLLGLADDFLALKPSSKLMGQVVAACAFVLAAGQTPWLDLPAADALITIAWFVAISNAFNLLDNMDGLCAGVAAIAALAFCLGADVGPSLVAIGAALAGASTGFLLYNFHPARVFMGDSGSIFLGSMLAMLTLRGGQDHSMGVVSTLVFPVLLMLIPLFDTVFVAVSRKLSARSASKGGSDHTSHRLVSMGFPEPKAVLLLYAFAALSGATAVTLSRASFQDATLLTGVLLVALTLLGVRLARVNVYGEADFILLRQQSFTPLLIDVTYKRRIFEVLLDVGLVSFAYYAAYVLRFDADLPKYYGLLVQSLPIVIACQLVGFYAAGVYRGSWRYISLFDLATYAKGLVYGTLGTILVLVYLYRFGGYSRGVFIIHTLLLGVLVIGSRVAFRSLGDMAHRYRSAGRRVAVYGAGDAASLLVRELRNNTSLEYRPVLFLDDDASKHGKRILGVPVVGGEEALLDVLTGNKADVIVLSTPLPADRLKRIASLCDAAGAEVLRWQVLLSPFPDTHPHDRRDARHVH